MYGAAVLAMKGPVVLEPLTCQVCVCGGGGARGRVGGGRVGGGSFVGMGPPRREAVMGTTCVDVRHRSAGCDSGGVGGDDEC
jgi:hypothetical protein